MMVVIGLDNFPSLKDIAGTILLTWNNVTMLNTVFLLAEEGRQNVCMKVNYLLFIESIQNICYLIQTDVYHSDKF